jgi:hypothetical protein
VWWLPNFVSEVSLVAYFTRFDPNLLLAKLG